MVLGGGQTESRGATPPINAPKCNTEHYSTGGEVIIVMRKEYLDYVEEYKDKLEPYMDQLVAKGKWTKVWLCVCKSDAQSDCIKQLPVLF